MYESVTVDEKSIGRVDDICVTVCHLALFVCYSWLSDEQTVALGLLLVAISIRC